MYEVDYEHVINKNINGVDVTLYFSKEKNEKIKDIILGILLDNYEKRIQEYIEKSQKGGLKKDLNYDIIIWIAP